MGLIGVSFLLSIALGYGMWVGLGLLGHLSFQPTGKIGEDIPLPYPFGITPSRANAIQKVCFYNGLVMGLILFFLMGKSYALLGFGVFFLVGFVFKQGIDMWVRQWKGDMKKELPVFLDTFLSLYQSGVKMEQAIRDSLAIAESLTPAFQPVLERWHNRGGPEAALETLRIFDLSEIKTCATMFSQLARGGERSIEFLKEWKIQLIEMAHLNREAGSATKPILFTSLLFLPFGASMVTWFYPFFIAAMHMFDGFLGM